MHFKIKQQTYDWRGDLAPRAQKAVEAFFDRYENFDTAADQAAYVKWAVPAATETINSCGESVASIPDLFPYMWASVEGGPNGLVSY